MTFPHSGKDSAGGAALDGLMSTAEFDKVCIKYVDKIAQLDAEKARKIRSKNERNLRKNNLTGDVTSAKERLKKITREEAVEAAQSVLWNWNNVEATLLMCCVLVCTFGIMFNAVIHCLVFLPRVPIVVQSL